MLTGLLDLPVRGAIRALPVALPRRQHYETLVACAPPKAGLLDACVLLWSRRVETTQTNNRTPSACVSHFLPAVTCRHPIAASP